MPVIDPAQVDVGLRRMEARFWRNVEETLDRVFASEREQAAEYRRRLSLYREQVVHSPAAEQLLVYHSEPLDIAADLAGVTATREHVSAYLALAHASAEA